MNIKPAYLPLDPTLADAVVLAVAARGGEAVRPRFYAGVFEREDLADARVIGRVLREAGLDAEALLDAAHSDAVRDAYGANTRLTLDLGVVGAPNYVLNGEAFWGRIAWTCCMTRSRAVTRPSARIFEDIDRDFLPLALF